MLQAQLQALLQGMAALQDQQRVQHEDAENARENRSRQERVSRQAIDDMVKQSATCSGSSNGPVRQWLCDIELAVVRFNNAEVIHVVTRTVSGPLRQEVERYLTQTAAARGIQREVVPWDDVRQHITTQFLSADE